jgi:hypothetical protein
MEIMSGKIICISNRFVIDGMQQYAYQTENA